MNYKDLIEGEYYFNKAFDCSYIFIFEKPFNTKFHLFKSKSDKEYSQYNDHGSFGSEEQIMKNIRFANIREKQWLMTCIDHNKFIPLNNIMSINNIDINEINNLINDFESITIEN